MRILKYRAYDKVNKKMLKYLSGILWGKPIVPTDYVQGIFNFEIPDNYEYLEGGEMMIVSGSELMEYIGLPDKNGTEIYEGDIVRFQIANIAEERFETMLVRYSSPAGAFKIGYYLFTQVYTPDLEIIGDIYHNPELLKS